MSTTVQRTPRSGRQSLFFQDMASPVSARRGKVSSPSHAAAVSSLWRESIGGSDLPPPPIHTLEDKSDFSPESGFPDYQISPETKPGPRTPTQTANKEFSTPVKGKSEASTSYASKGVQQNQQGSPGLNWWSPASAKSSGEQDEKGRSSSGEGVVQFGAFITPPPREVAKPEVQRNSLQAGNLNQEEWVTVYGQEKKYLIDKDMKQVQEPRIRCSPKKMKQTNFTRFFPGDTNSVLREFEKCGVILKHVPGPSDSNWMHILYQNHSDAQKALRKNGMNINGTVIVGVKPLDPLQRQTINEKLANQGFTPLPPPSARASDINTFRAPSRSYYLQNGNMGTRQTGAIASPAKSMVSKIMDLMFGV
ncbi:nuclear pore complex protein NUP35 [Senna tora]|uniref:Nuclear pore complex protein NUP35 n=1 Tax=Senna tora TaxID=362788 RepID=A0A834XHL5_9FABA|nr:nuclear pore complex protein NUP35 [Senna tora]